GAGLVTDKRDKNFGIAYHLSEVAREPLGDVGLNADNGSVQVTDSVTKTNGAGRHDICVDPSTRKASEIPKVPPVMPGDRAEDAWVVGQLPLRQGRVDTTRTRNRDTQNHFIADREFPACPRVLNVWFPIEPDNHIRSESPDIKAPLCIRTLQVIDCRSRDQVHTGVVEESTRRCGA